LPQNASLYTKWIEMHTSDEFSALAHHIREMADRIGYESNPAELTAMCQAYQTSVRLEHRFWEMAVSLEGWKS
ncbi:MAG: thiaminase II, partial [Chloroflexota bacterium]|nr:thiaminase II [Chloroflexota bacterium]